MGLQLSRSRARTERKHVLPNGQAVYGASRFDAKYHQFIGCYFGPDFQLRPGATVFDVGANIGMFSLEILRRCQGDAHVFAFEPGPQTFAYLRRNVEELFPRADVRLYEAAVGDQEGATTLYYSPRTTAMASLYPNPLTDTDSLIDAFFRDPPPDYRGPAPKRLGGLSRTPLKKLLKLGARRVDPKLVQATCPLTTLSAVIKEHEVREIDFLKIDVEGAELDVLRGVAADDWPKIKQLAAEVHDIDNRVETIRGLLTRSGFDEVRAEQEWPFEGTNVYTVQAIRGDARTDAPRPGAG